MKPSVTAATQCVHQPGIRAPEQCHRPDRWQNPHARRRRRFHRPPRSVALLHCIGSRDVNNHEYCSRVCCMYALKYTHLIKEKVGHDTAGLRFLHRHALLRRRLRRILPPLPGGGHQPSSAARWPKSPTRRSPGEEGKLVAIAEDTLLGETCGCRWTWWCCAPPWRPVPTRRRGARLRGQPGCRRLLSGGAPQAGAAEHGHRRCFSGRCCQGPKDIPDTVAQASGAAAKALALATRGQVEVPSTIIVDRSGGLRRLPDLYRSVPYGAIEFDERRQGRWSTKRPARAAAAAAVSAPAAPPRSHISRAGRSSPNSTALWMPSAVV
jgi:heterodisulfide reductase subunit A